MTDEQRKMAQATFLEAFRATGIIRRAATAAGVNRQTVYGWKERDPAFAEAFAEAEEDACDVIREAIFERAVEGWDEPVFYQGEECGAVHKKSDVILSLMAKARLPEYRATIAPKGSVPGDTLDTVAQGDGLPVVRHVVEVIEVKDWEQVGKQGLRG